MGQHVTLDLVNISRAAIGEALVRCGVEIASKSFCDNASLTIAARQALIRETFYGLDKANPQAPGHLARVYESSLGVSLKVETDGCVALAPSEDRRAHGSFYTPQELVDELVAESFARLRKVNVRLDSRSLGVTFATRSLASCLGGNDGSIAIHPRLNVSILDPACGGGAFLVRCFEEMLRADPGADRLELLRRHIYGVDLDPLAVETTKRALLLAAGIQDEDALAALADNIVTGDALVEDAGLSDAALNIRAKFARVFERDKPGFDLVIGNPPWISYSGRHGHTLDPKRKAYYERHYDTSGWLSLHSLFVERAVRDLSAGVTAFVVPDQIAHLIGYRALRACVARHTLLARVRYWGEEIFGGAVTPALTFIADKNHDGPAVIIGKDGQESTGVFNGDQSWSACGGDLLERLLAQGESLGALVADPGVHTGNCSRKLIVSSADPSYQSAPILEGKQVQRYRCDAPAKWLRLGYQPTAGEYFTIREEERYERARFVIRQTAGFPIVGPRVGATYFRNSLLALFDPQDGRDVRYVVGALNSTLMRWVYRQMVVESGQRAFPQVKVGALRKLPVKPIRTASERRLHDEIVNAVQLLLDGYASETFDSTHMEAALDRAVYELFGLRDDDIAAVASRALA